MVCVRVVSVLVLAVCAWRSTALGAPTAVERLDLAKAVKQDSITLPTPGEVLAAINKQGKPNWQAQYRPPIPTSFTSRPQIALNLGGLLADGYIAVEAEDSQQVKNIGKDIMALAKGLGVSQNILARGSSINDFAEANKWSVLKEELEATQNEVKNALLEQHDKELVILVSLGAWIRGTEAVSSWIAVNYTPSAAKLLRQPAIVGFLRSRISELPDKTQDNHFMRGVNQKLTVIERMVSFPRDQAPTVEDVIKLRDAASELVKEIAKKETK